MNDDTAGADAAPATNDAPEQVARCQGTLPGNVSAGAGFAPGSPADAVILAFDSARSPLSTDTVRDALAACRTRDAAARADWTAFALQPAYLHSSDPWRAYFRPARAAGPADRTDIDSDGAALVSHWEARAASVAHPVLAARYTDLVWDLGRRLSGRRIALPVARRAIALYLDVLAGGLAPSPDERFICARRAVDLAAQIRDPVALQAARTALLDLHALETGRAGGRWHLAFDHLHEHKRAALSSAEYDRLIGDFERILDIRADRSGTAPHWRDALGAAERLLAHYGRLRRNEDIRRVHATLGHAFEREAARRDRSARTPAQEALACALRANLLQHGVESYRLAGCPDGETRLRGELAAALDTVRAASTLLASPPTATRAHTFAQRLPGADRVESFMRLAATFLPDVDRLETIAAACAAGLSFSGMALRPAGLPGQDFLARVGPRAEDPFGRTVWQANWEINAATPYLQAAFDTLAGLHAVTPQAVLDWTGHLFDAARRALLAEGLAAWCAHDHVKALHTFTPLIEYGLRSLVCSLGLSTLKPHGTIPGISVAIGMGDILYNDAMIAALGAEAPRLRLYLLTLYADPRGRNLRNEIAHGLLAPEDIHAGTLLWLVHTLVVLGAWSRAAHGEARMDLSPNAQRDMPWHVSPEAVAAGPPPFGDAPVLSIIQSPVAARNAR
jgi:lysyl-tRNA synthetase class 1